MTAETRPVRSGLARLLNDDPRVEVVGEAVDGEDAARQVTLLRPDVILMDIKMPNSDGVQATQRIMAENPAAKVLILTTFDTDSYVLQALKAGVDLLAGASNGKEFYDGLTARELEILKLLATGIANKQIAFRLKISEKTVRNHVSNMYEKLNIADRAQAALYAVRKGLVEA